LETPIQRRVGLQLYAKGLVHRLERFGLLNPDLSVAHAVWVDSEEIRLLKERGVTVIHNPVSNLTLGSGKAPLREYLADQISVALGTDASNCGGPHNLFEAMRIAAILHRVGEPDFSRWPQPEEVWTMATLGGAKTIGMEGRVGRIAPGYQADLVILNPSATTWAPLDQILTQLVHHETGRSVESVMINGHWTMREGKILTFSENNVIQQVQERYEHLMEQSKSSVAFARKLEPFHQTLARKFHGLD